jgi:AcrR family transcriptional regulator
VDAIRIVCYSNLKSLIDNPVQRLLPLVTVLVSDDPAVRDRRAEHYRRVQEKWRELFEATFALYGIGLRPGIDVDEAADILTALADGLAMRATGDPDAAVIDRRRGDTLLGRAATMMLLAGIDPGDGLSL